MGTEGVMTVGKLRNAIAQYPDDMAIVMSSDAEGNKFSPLDRDGVVDGMYVPETTWSGEIYLTPEAVEMGRPAYTDDDLPPDNAVRVLVFYPIN